MRHIKDRTKNESLGTQGKSSKKQYLGYVPAAKLGFEKTKRLEVSKNHPDEISF